MQRTTTAAVRRALPNNTRPGGAAGGALRVVPVPADGSCLFHAIAHGLPAQSAWARRPHRLRESIAQYVYANPKRKINGLSIHDWVVAHTNRQTTPSAYAVALRDGEWGGELELRLASEITGAAIHVFERAADPRRFRRIAQYSRCEQSPSVVVRVLYSNQNHYDALELTLTPSIAARSPALGPRLARGVLPARMRDPRAGVGSGYARTGLAPPMQARGRTL